DSWMPGWTATVDGRPAQVLRGNSAQRVIPLPDAGRHVIVMEYRAPGLLVGCATSLVSAMAWTLIVLRGTRHRFRARTATRPAVRGGHWAPPGPGAPPGAPSRAPQRVRTGAPGPPIWRDPGEWWPGGSMWGGGPPRRAGLGAGDRGRRWTR